MSTALAMPWPRIALGVLVSCSWFAPVPADSQESGKGPIPARPELLRFPPIEFEAPRGEDARHTLSNGVAVYVVADRTVPLVDVALALPIGEILDPAEQSGLASLTATMLRRGGTADLDPAAFDDRADELAIEINSVGGSFRSGVVMSCAPRVLGPALGLLADLVLRPRFDSAALEDARRTLAESVERRRRDPGYLLERRWNGLIHGREHFLAREMAPQHVDRLDREALLSFHRQHWGPKRAAIAVSGDVEVEAVVAQLEGLFGAWRDPEGGSIAAAATVAPEVSPASSSGAPGLYRIAAGGAAGHLVIGHEGVRREAWDDPDLFALMVMSEILGGHGAISRLSSRLRAREAVAYQVDVSYGIGTQERGVFQVSLGVAPEHAARAAGIAIEEIRKMRSAPPAATELELARKALIDGFPSLFSSAEQRAGRFAEDALLGRPHAYWRTYRQRISEVDGLRVLAAARRFLDPQRLRELWLGPPLDPGQWRGLGLGEVRELE